MPEVENVEAGAALLAFRNLTARRQAERERTQTTCQLITGLGNGADNFQLAEGREAPRKNLGAASKPPQGKIISRLRVTVSTGQCNSYLNFFQKRLEFS